MKNIIPKNTLGLLIVGVAFALMSAPAGAATGGATAGVSARETGAITGRVRNVVTNDYLNNARVSIRGTNQMVYTDNFGNFQLVGVPGGPIVLEVFYTGLDPAQIPLAVRPGETIDQAVDLTSVDRYGQDATTVKLDAFVVNTDRETDAQAIAINEQRFAPNIKTVMSTDALGDVLGNAAGEFLKYMPGVTVEYDGRDISTISVRGIGGGKTAVEVDGVPGSSTWVPTTRQTDLRAMSLNDITRVEVTKSPTPATPADSLGGHVNMVSKSAFERSGRQLRLELSLVGNQHNLTLKKTPDSHLDRSTYKVLPGLSFDFVWPVAKTFGVVIAGMHTNMFHEQNIMTTGWGNSGTGTNAASASPSNPILNGISLQDGPRSILRDTLSIKADWKVTRHSVLSLGHTINRATTRIGTLIFGFNTGTNGTPNPATGVPMTWGPTFTFGATGRGSFANTGTNQLLNQRTDTTNLAYRFDDGRWKIDASVGRSASALKRRFEDAGFFFQAASTVNRPVRVNYLDFRDSYPHRIEGFDNANLPFEWRDISNFMGTTANNMTSYKRGENHLARLNIRRRFEFFPFPTALQVGGSQRRQMLDTAHENIKRGYPFDASDHKV